MTVQKKLYCKPIYNGYKLKVTSHKLRGVFSKETIIINLITYNFISKLELNLINDIYFVEIINKANKHEFKKLIISTY